MDGNLLGALIGGGVVAVGWFVTNLLNQSAKAKSEKAAFLRRQVEEFYCPLLALVQEKIALQKIQDAQLEGESGDIWCHILMHFQDGFLVPIMREIGNILRSKPYLAAEWPPSFDQFLELQAQSIALYLLWRGNDHRIEGKIKTVPWPPSLEEDIHSMKLKLEAEYRKLAIGPPLPTGRMSRSDEATAAVISELGATKPVNAKGE